MKPVRYILKKAFFTPTLKGRIGENKTAAIIDWVNLWGEKGRILQNIYLPRNNGTTSEIDILYITRKGLIVVENKNYSGFIFGNENNRNWTSTLYAGKNWLGGNKVEKHQFYNPIWQNNSHIRALKEYFDCDIPSISIISFSDRCQLKDITYTTPDTYVCNASMLPRVIKIIRNEYPNSLDEYDISNIYNELLPFTNVDLTVKNQHISNIASNKNNPNICPYCGGQLVIRTAKQGSNIGKEFWGCSNFPKCRFTRNL